VLQHFSEAMAILETVARALPQQTSPHGRLTDIDLPGDFRTIRLCAEDGRYMADKS